MHYPLKTHVNRPTNTWTKAPAKTQAGFSLIELMIASMIGIFVMGGAISIHASNKQAFILQESTSYTQKNARFMINRFNQKISAAGYSGFLGGFIGSPVDDSLNSTGNNILWDIKKPIFGYNDHDGSTLFGITNIVSGSDVVMLKTMTNVTSIQSQDAVANTITFNDSVFNEADIIIATDINKAAIFQVSTVNQATVTLFIGSTAAKPGNSAMPTTAVFDSTAEVGKLETVMYMLGEDANGNKGLYETVLNTTTGAVPDISNITELVPNVEDLQFVYGVDTNGDGLVDQYSHATDVTNNNQWDKLVSIGAAMVVSSDNSNVASSNNSYSFNSSTFSFTKNSSGDKKYRRPYITYVTLKNI